MYDPRHRIEHFVRRMRRDQAGAAVLRVASRLLNDPHPMMGGLETPAALGGLAERLAERYGSEDAERITSGNDIRVLRELWRQ